MANDDAERRPTFGGLLKNEPERFPPPVSAWKFSERSISQLRYS
jgi:hypothetical protein